MKILLCYLPLIFLSLYSSVLDSYYLYDLHKFDLVLFLNLPVPPFMTMTIFTYMIVVFSCGNLIIVFKPDI